MPTDQVGIVTGWACPVCGKVSHHPDDARYGHCAACGVNRLQPGVYVGNDGVMHLVIPEMLTAAGYKDTPENRATLEQVARHNFARVGVEVDVVA